jgi:hypothetical protein
MRWYECFDCKRQISADDVQRYEVTRRRVSGRRITTRHQRVNLCASCVAKRDRRDVARAIAYVVLVAAALLALFVLR